MSTFGRTMMRINTPMADFYSQTYIFVRMLRKYLTILFLVAAQIVVLGHSVVSHHHHTNVSFEDAHHGKNGTHEHPQETPLELAFSSFIHGGEYILFANAEVSKIAVAKEAPKPVNALPVGFFAPAKYIIVASQKHIYPPDKRNVYESISNGVHKLRGPPAFIVS